MNQITFPRTSYDGTKISKEELEKWFLAAEVKTKKIGPDGKEHYVDISFVKQIENELSAIKCNSKEEKRLLNLLINKLECILISGPKTLENIKDSSDKHFHDILKDTNNKSTKFSGEILKAFNYKGYRENILITLAEKLNIKSCPYCNMYYTLFAEDGNSYSKELTKFQFDHFFDKDDYPFLSMSLYNLIPSCAVCNQGKSKGKISLNFHPYYSNIAKQFNFRVTNPLPLYYGAKDRIEIALDTNSTSVSDVKDFNNMFNIQTLYRRHRDVVQEVFDKAYIESYYYNADSFFKFLNGPKSKEYFERLLYGTYLSEDEIEKRPMSKFIQDIRKQAMSYYSLLCSKDKGSI